MIRYLLPIVIVLTASRASVTAAELVGVTVTPHAAAESMRYRRPRDPELAARVQLFVTGPARPTTFAGRTPAELLQEGEWAWHDLAAEVQVPEGALAVWTFNGKSSRWGVAGQGVVIEDRCSRDAIYVATTSQQVRGDIEERRKASLAREEAFPADLAALEKLKQ